MSMEHWSEKVDVIRIADGESLDDDVATVEQQAKAGKHDLILDFSGVQSLNSSQIGKLLKARKQLASHKRKLVLTGLSDNVWGALVVMGLDQVFAIHDDVASGLAALQLK